MVNREIFEKFICQNGKISYHELDKFFANLEPIELDEIIGEWQGGYFSTGVSKLEILFNDFIIFMLRNFNLIPQKHGIEKNTE